jgi:hypothetical protein
MYLQEPLMILSLLIALSTPAAAGDFINSVGEDAVMGGEDIGGMNWVRIFNNGDGGWWVTYHWQAEGEDPGYNVAPMTDGRVLDHAGARRRLVEWPETKDHAITRCSDGSFLHAYSIGTGNESARSARYSPDWEVESHEWIEQDVDARAHNDLPVICSEPLQATAFTNHASFTATIFEIDEAGTATINGELGASGHISGASWIYYPPRDQYLVVSNGEPGLRRVWYNRDLSVDEIVDWEPIGGLNRSFWPQKIERVGEYWLMVYLSVEYGGMYLADDGDVYVVVMDSSFNTVDSTKVSTNTPGDLGSARPHFARQGAKMMVVWDKGIRPYAVKVQLSAAALGIEDEDTGWDFGDEDGDGDSDGGSDSYDPCAQDDDEDTGTRGVDELSGGHSSEGLSGTEDTSSSEVDAECDDKGCGCSALPSEQVPWWLLLGLGLAHRRRRGHAELPLDGVLRS